MPVIPTALPMHEQFEPWQWPLQYYCDSQPVLYDRSNGQLARSTAEVA
jgi:hypothetical protein